MALIRCIFRQSEQLLVRRDFTSLLEVERDDLSHATGMARHEDDSIGQKERQTSTAVISVHGTRARGAEQRRTVDRRATLPGALVVNIGDMMEIWTNGEFVATSRYSFPLFFAIDHDTKVKPLDRFVTDERPAKDGLTAGEHLFAQTAQSFNYLKARLARGGNQATRILRPSLLFRPGGKIRRLGPRARITGGERSPNRILHRPPIARLSADPPRPPDAVAELRSAWS